MINPNEILKHSHYFERKDLKDFVYTEYLQLLILKYISDINSKKPYYLFGAYLNRLSFERSKFGNSLDFFTQNKSVKDYRELNERIKAELELEGYTVEITQIAIDKFKLIIGSEFLLAESIGRKSKYEITLNYYFALKYFTKPLWKSITGLMNIRGYDINTYVEIIRPEFSFSVLLKLIYVRKKIEPIELFDVYRLITTHVQQAKNNFFKPNEFKNLINAIKRAKQKLSTHKIKAISLKNFYVIDKNRIEDFFNFNNWITRLKN